VMPERPHASGHAIEARIYAEDPVKFLPSAGTLEQFRLPHLPNVRVDTGYKKGMKITPFYDPLLAKVIVCGPDRAAAVKILTEALESCEITGVKSNIPALITILESEQFRSGNVHTGLTSALIHKNSS
jgi:acetyl-CoA carboxylase biotin carboxylase subunit